MRKMIPIIIVTYNKLEQFTIPCIESIIENTSGPFKIILVDNASSDNTAEIIKSKYKFIDVISNTANTGWAGGNIDGINHISNNYDYDYFCLLNSDTLLSYNWLSKLADLLDSNQKAASIIPTERVLNTNLLKKIYINYLSENVVFKKMISATPLRLLKGKGISMPREVKPVVRNVENLKVNEINEINSKIEKKYRNKVEKSAFIKSGYCVLLRKHIQNEYVYYLENFNSLFPSKSIEYWSKISAQKNVTHLLSKGTYVYHYRGGSGGYFI
ncbi:MAG: glycosyltransferase family 2 protein [Fibrobacter sp.]|nr:glycosyltransferase family 2 protein [Fibrobacter sp.]